MKKIILCLISCYLIFILSACKTNNSLNADNYKQILLDLGYTENEIYDKTFNEGNLLRWVGLSGDLYACLFEYKTNSAAEDKKESLTGYFNQKSSEILYLNVEGSTLIIIASDQENMSEANLIMDKITK